MSKLLRLPIRLRPGIHPGLALLFSLFLFVSSVSSACPYCFTDTQSPQPRSTEAGVLVLVGVIVFVLGMIASLAFQWARRARALEKHSG